MASPKSHPRACAGRIGTPSDRSGVGISPDNGNISAWGRGDPFPAIEKAFTYQVNEIYLLSDNLFSKRLSPEETQNSINKLITMLDGNVQHVHVMQFFDRDPHRVLKQIAETFDGRHDRVEPQVVSTSNGNDPLVVP